MSGQYDIKDDFTVVSHPFMTKMSPPLTSTGDDVDYTYFSPDCFHFSTKGHEVAAVQIWNSLVKKKCLIFS
jgi:phospholipase B1